jgi:hypothetical protein
MNAENFPNLLQMIEPHIHQIFPPRHHHFSTALVLFKTITGDEKKNRDG